MHSARLLLSRFKTSRITAATTLFVLLVCAIVLGITAWNAWRGYQLELSEAGTTTENMARSLAQHADDAFKFADMTLVGVSERIVKDGTSPKALARLHDFLATVVSEQPEFSALYVFDKDGNWLVNSRDMLVVPSSNANREYFVYHQNHPDLSPHIGAPVRSRMSHQWVIPVSRRLNDRNGQFSGVAVVAIELDYFNRFYALYDIGHDGSILLLLNQGTQLTRWPLLTDSIGKDVSDGPVLNLYASSNQESGNAIVTAPTDGVERLLGYDHLPHFPAVAVVALSEKEILTAWVKETSIQCLIILAVIGMLGVLGFRLIGQISLRMQAEEALLVLNRTLQKMALQDGLTGLANRRQFDTVFQDELSRARRAGSSLALIMIDVDWFKRYNDLYGHVAGDECLRQVSKIFLAAEVRAGDLAARYGGEEFAVLLPNTDMHGAFKVAQDICTAVRELAIKHDGNVTGIVTVSAGVSAFTPVTGADTQEMLIDAADEALYEAKAGGRNQTRIYHKTPLKLVQFSGAI